MSSENRHISHRSSGLGGYSNEKNLWRTDKRGVANVIHDLGGDLLPRSYKNGHEKMLDKAREY